MVPALLIIHDVDMATGPQYLESNLFPAGWLDEASLQAPPPTLLVGKWHIPSEMQCLKVSLFRRHHSAAEGRRGSWSGLQFHQRGGIPWAGWKWTAVGERHIRWYVSVANKKYSRDPWCIKDHCSDEELHISRYVGERERYVNSSPLTFNLWSRTWSFSFGWRFSFWANV